MIKQGFTKGFTLIEIMIVVAIVAILASIAYASYEDSLNKSRRADGKDALLSRATKQEQWFLQNRSYTNDITDLGESVSTEGYYALTAAYSLNGNACADETCYTLTATPQSGQAGDDQCAELTINNLGQKKAEDSDGNDSSDICW